MTSEEIAINTQTEINELPSPTPLVRDLMSPTFRRQRAHRKLENAD